MLPLLFDGVDRFPLFFEEETERSFAPALDVYETKDAYELVLDVPGVAKSDLNVIFEDGSLRIEGERKAPELAEGTKGRSERWTGRFTRTLTLPEDADTAAIEAKLENGVLTLLVKKAEQKKPRQIAVR